MTIYEIPTLLEVGSVETSVLMLSKNSSATDAMDGSESFASASVLDID